MANVINLLAAQNTFPKVPAGSRPAYPFGIKAGIAAHF